MTDHAHVRLMNDRRWPWLILIPLAPDIEELHQLSTAQREGFMADVNLLSRELQRLSQCRSINVAMLGNVVSQLHCHVIARDEGDPNWPAPVWGHGTAVPYVAEQMHGLSESIRQVFQPADAAGSGASDPAA